VNSQRAAEIQVVLEGVRLPATRDELISYARSYDATAAAELGVLPDRRYDRIDEVGEALVRVQPVVRAAPRLPRPESGLPPGGPDDVLREQQARAGSDGADPHEEHAPSGRGLL
jgi:hypothetical protein